MARTPHSEIPLTHRILVVDDDPHIREVIRVALRKAGMSVTEARDGKARAGRTFTPHGEIDALPDSLGEDVALHVR